MVVLKIAVEFGLQIHIRKDIFPRQIFHNRSVLIHPAAHGVSRIRLHKIRRHEDDALDTRQRLFDQLPQIPFIFFRGKRGGCGMFRRGARS